MTLQFIRQSFQYCIKPSHHYTVVSSVIQLLKTSGAWSLSEFSVFFITFKNQIIFFSKHMLVLLLPLETAS